MMTEKIRAFTNRHAGLWQAVKFALLGLVASAAEMASFALLRFFVFSHMAAQSFRWWIFDYGAASGGLGYFLSVCLSYALGQGVNFLVQRRYTFASSADIGRSLALYIPMAALVWLLQLWLPTAIRPGVASLLGETAGDLTVKLLCMFAGLLIAYPASKFLIFPQSKSRAS
ncbi:MAG: hypothetical protein Q4B42_05050 [Oscillospiraceae bacterium]|nr:hypothetical protein [Oscillospiraceae bacterium]